MKNYIFLKGNGQLLNLTFEDTTDMNKFVFFSDFDNTLTKEDFYLMIINKYKKEEGLKLLKQWQNKELTDVVFLNKIFNNINKSQKEIDDEIFQIPLDPDAIKFIEIVKDLGGDFYILSAGSSYYIERLLKYHNITGVKVLANGGRYIDGGIELIPDKSSPYYHEVFGIDKEKIVNNLKKDYSTTFYFGDSLPDLKAALAADKTYAKSELQKLLHDKNRRFIAVNNYLDVIQDFKKNIRI